VGIDRKADMDVVLISHQGAAFSLFAFAIDGCVDFCLSVGSGYGLLDPPGLE